MSHFSRRLGALAASVLLFSYISAASDLPRLSFNELTDNSELIVSGQVTRTWADWDVSHKHIWTHYELAISASHKGSPGRTVEIAEPGGRLDGMVMSITGATGYVVGEKVMVFLSRLPNGYLRTAGFGQGKYIVDPNGLLHGFRELKDDPSASAVRSLDGMTAGQAGRLVSARIRGGNAQ